MDFETTKRKIRELKQQLRRLETHKRRLMFEHRFNMGRQQPLFPPIQSVSPTSESARVQQVLQQPVQQQQVQQQPVQQQPQVHQNELIQQLIQQNQLLMKRLDNVLGNKHKAKSTKPGSTSSSTAAATTTTSGAGTSGGDNVNTDLYMDLGGNTS
jgi:hypothetical protein